MWYYIIKVLVSAVLIVAISEISKRSSFWGGILASVPLVSVLAFIWLYIDTKSVEKISQLSYSVFWLVIPSLSLFITLPLLLKKVDFPNSNAFINYNNDRMLLSDGACFRKIWN